MKPFYMTRLHHAEDREIIVHAANGEFLLITDESNMLRWTTVHTLEKQEYVFVGFVEEYKIKQACKVNA